MLSISRFGRRDQCMGRQECSALLQKRKLAWGDAEEKSYRAGKPFKNRAGDMAKTPPTDMLGVVLKRYCEDAGVYNDL